MVPMDLHHSIKWTYIKTYIIIESAAVETSSIMELDPVQIALNIPPSMKIDFANKDIRSF